MTLIIGMHLSDYVIIASDKKEVAVLNGIVIPLHEDANKIINTDMGLVTGSGFVDLLNRVKNRIALNQICHTDEILNIIKTEREAIAQILGCFDEAERKILFHTGWIFSYRTIIDDEIRIRLAIYHPSIDEQYYATINEKDAIAVFPLDIVPEQAKSFNERLRSSMLSLDNEPDINRNMSYNISQLLTLIAAVSEISETVSKTCDIGIAFKDGTVLMANNVSIDSGSFPMTKI